MQYKKAQDKGFLARSRPYRLPKTYLGARKMVEKCGAIHDGHHRIESDSLHKGHVEKYGFLERSTDAFRVSHTTKLNHKMVKARFFTAQIR